MTEDKYVLLYIIIALVVGYIIGYLAKSNDSKGPDSGSYKEDLDYHI